MKHIFLRTAAFSLTVGLVGCGATASDPGAGEGTESETTTIAEQLIGLWGSKAQGQPWLELLEDGRIQGSDGCNRLTGNWTAAEDVEFGQVAGTKMFCEGVDDWLSGAATGQLAEDGRKLVIADSNGKELGTLTINGGDS